MQTFPPNFMMKKFSVNVQFPRIFLRITQKSAETVRLRKSYSPENEIVKLILYTVKIINSV